MPHVFEAKTICQICFMHVSVLHLGVRSQEIQKSKGSKKIKAFLPDRSITGGQARRSTGHF